MPHLNKRAIGMFFKSNCKRQLRLNLAPTAAEQASLNMPPKAVTRFGFEVVTQQGEEWEAEKINDLVTCYGAATVLGTQQPPAAPGGPPTWQAVALDQALNSAAPGLFVIQPEYDVPPTFDNGLGVGHYRTQFNLSYASLRPDVLRVYAPGTFPRFVSPLGQSLALPANDGRLQLRLVDVKLTAEPSHRHFAELTYYMMVLAAWLQHRGLANRFVVVDRGAVWPGSHDAAAITRLTALHRTNGTQPTTAQLDAALDEDLEDVPLQAMAQRLVTFFQRDVAEVLGADPNWRSLSWHISPSCTNCEFLGLDLPPNQTAHAFHCHSEATAADDLTRIPFLSRGSKLELHAQHVATTAQLAQHPGTSAVYNGHHSLRADRTIISSRASALAQSTPLSPPGRRTAALPDWADLRIYVTVDFDPGSGITYAFGVRTLWMTQLPGTNQWQPQSSEHAFIVPDRDPVAERRELLNALDVVQNTFVQVLRANPSAAAQVYVWDNVQGKHMKRLMERHLHDPQLQQRFRNLIWLFPPESVMPNAELEKRSPVAVVKPALRQLVGLPIEYDYSVLETARVYHAPSAAPTMFNVHPLFEAPLSDQIPFERAHEIWTHRGFRPGTTSFIPWNSLVAQMERTVKTRLRAMASILERLERDLRGQQRLLLRATTVRPGRPRRARGVSVDGQLWLAYAELASVSARLETATIHAMEVHEREARFYSAILTRRLQGAGLATALTQLGLTAAPDLWCYELSPASRDTKLKQGEFLVAISPIAIPGFLSRTVVNLVGGAQQFGVATTIAGAGKEYLRADRFARVTILEIDRDRGLVAVRIENPGVLQQLEAGGHCSFASDAILDPVHDEYWTKKLERCLKAIGNPPLAQAAPATLRALP